MVAWILAMLMQAASPQCVYDRTILQLGYMAFDQDMKGGWRALAARPECAEKAADVIAYYRQRQEASLSTLYVHEAQQRATIGQSERAIPLFEKARRADDADGWNDYMDASVAFLRRDRAGLLAARQRLAGRPKPAGWDIVVDGHGNLVPPTPWPLNLHVVDAFIACFDRPFAEIGDAACRSKPTAR